MRETSSGHFCLKIELPKSGLNFTTVQMDTNLATSEMTEKLLTDCLVTTDGELTYKDVAKLHDVFGHVSIRKLEDLIKKSSKWTSEVKQYLEHIENSCKSCKLHKKAKPSPNVSLPRASRFKPDSYNGFERF